MTKSFKCVTKCHHLTWPLALPTEYIRMGVEWFMAPPIISTLTCVCTTTARIGLSVVSGKPFEAKMNWLPFENIFKLIFCVWKLLYFVSNIMEICSQGLINSKLALVLMMAWRRTGDKPSFEPMRFTYAPLGVDAFWYDWQLVAKGNSEPTGCWIKCTLLKLSITEKQKLKFDEMSVNYMNFIINLIFHHVLVITVYESHTFPRNIFLCTLKWRHNERDGVSNPHCLDCLLNRLFRWRSKPNTDQSSASLAFARGIHRWTVDSLHKGPVTRKMFTFDDFIMNHRVMKFLLIWVLVAFCCSCVFMLLGILSADKNKAAAVQWN